MYKYIHTCIYIHIYMSAHIYTYTYIHTRIQNVHLNARKHAWNDGAAANVQGAVADKEGLHFSFVRRNQTTFRTSNSFTALHWSDEQSTQLWRSSAQLRNGPLETKGRWRTTNPRKQPITQITTARRPDNTCSSALVWSQSTKFMAHPSREPEAMLQTRITFSPFSRLYVYMYIYLMMMIAFITFDSSLAPLIEGLCSSNPCGF